MPKKLLATTITIALAITMLSAIPMSKGNFIPTESKMDIYSPMPSYHYIYQNTSSVLLDFAVRVPADAPHHYPEIKSIYYSLDGKSAVEVTNVEKYERVPWFSGICVKYNASLSLDNLGDGNHTVLVYCQDDMGNKLSATQEFAVANSSITPSPTPTNSISKDDNSEGFSFLAIATVGVLAIASLGLLVYFRRRKGKL